MRDIGCRPLGRRLWSTSSRRRKAFLSFEPEDDRRTALVDQRAHLLEVLLLALRGHRGEKRLVLVLDALLEDFLVRAHRTNTTYTSAQNARHSASCAASALPTGNRSRGMRGAVFVLMVTVPVMLDSTSDENSSVFIGFWHSLPRIDVAGGAQSLAPQAP